MSRLDSLYKKNHPTPVAIINKPLKKSRRVAFPLYYFYRSLRIVLVMWMLLLTAVIVKPWGDYYVKKTINTQNQQVLGTENTTKAVTAPTSTTSQTPPTFHLKKGSPRGEAGDLEIKAPIMEGITDGALSKGIGHHPDSVWPNQKGNMVIAGHSFDLDAENPYGEVFGQLREIEIGDQVSVTYQNKKYTYKIFKKETVSPSDMSLMGKSDNWQLTFYTCDPPKTDWRRLVFQAELIKIE